MWAAKGRQRAEWNQTSSILSLIYNANKKADAPVRGADDFNPMVDKKNRRLSPKDSVHVVGDAFGLPRPGGAK